MTPGRRLAGQRAAPAALDGTTDWTHKPGPRSTGEDGGAGRVERVISSDQL